MPYTSRLTPPRPSLTPRPAPPLTLHLTSTHRYDSLADKTVFAQASAPTAGFEGHRLAGGHLLPTADFANDYASPCTPPLFMPTMSYVVRPSEPTKMAWRTALLYPTPAERSLHAPAPSMCAAADEAHSAAEKWLEQKGAWLEPEPHLWLANYLAPLANRQRDATGVEPPRSLSEFWSRYLEDQLGPMPHALYAANGALFSASRAQLLAHPKSFYTRLLRAVTAYKEPVETYVSTRARTVASAARPPAAPRLLARRRRAAASPPPRRRRLTPLAPRRAVPGGSVGLHRRLRPREEDGGLRRRGLSTPSGMDAREV